MNQPEEFVTDDLPERYLAMLSGQRQLSSHTIDNYRRDIGQLAELAQGLSWTDLKTPDIRRFTAQLHARGLNPRSISRKLSAWRGFYRWLVEEAFLPGNPVEDIQAPTKNKPLPKALSVDDAVRLVATWPTPEKSRETRLCNQALFELLYSSGLRVSELSGLDKQAVHRSDYTSSGWIDLNEHEVTVTGKGNKKRVVPVGEAALVAIRNWLAVRGRFEKPGSLPDDACALFINTQGRRLSPRLIQLRLKAHARQLGLPVNVHPHVRRHSFASHLLQSSGDLRAVQEMLGHASIASTQIYTALDFQHLAEVYDAAHPRAKTKP